MKTLQQNSKGPLVGLLQSTLKKLSYYSGDITEIFGKSTLNAVKNFQSQYGLNADGIVGDLTWYALMPYINGYFNYKVISGDNLYSIADHFNTSINRILVANPKITNPNNLRIGDLLIIPVNTIIPTDISYTSEIMNINIKALKTIYPFLKIESIGYSVLGTSIPVIQLGRGFKKVYYSASIHANEWITTPVLMKFLEDFCLNYSDGNDILGYDLNNIFNSVTIYISPMLNPDGVDLVTGQIPSTDSAYIRCKKISENYSNIPFPDGWKANINGTDLNLQFPADWEQAKEIKYSQGFNSPAPRDFVGFMPISEPESKALYDFTLKHRFKLILSYHTQGEVIFWKFKDYLPPNSKEIGESFAKVSGYLLADTPYNSSFAGYKDWFIQDFNKPGYTIEAGLGTNPLPISQFDKIYSDNIGILILGSVL